jgi:hypothetical protein
MTSKPTLDYSLSVAAASVASVAIHSDSLDRGRLEIGVTASANEGGDNYGHLR